MKKLIISSQECFEAKNFSKSLEFAKDALKMADDNPRLHLLAGKAAVELKRYDEAVEFLETSASLDPNLMPPLIKLSALYNDLGEYAKLVKVKLRQIPLAQAKDNHEKVVQFHEQLIKALEQDKQYREALSRIETSLKLEGIDRIQLAQSCLRIQYTNLFRDVPIEFMKSVSLELILHLNETTPSEPPRFTIVRIITNLIALDTITTPDIIDFCHKTFQQLTPTTNNDSLNGWSLAAGILLLFSLEQEQQDQGTQIAVRVVQQKQEDNPYLLQAKWRAYAVLSHNFLSIQDYGKARRCSDLALINLKAAREVLPAVIDDHSSNNTKQKKKKILTFGAKREEEETDETRAIRILKERTQLHEKVIHMLLRTLFQHSAQLWHDRAVMLIRYYFQGSLGEIKSSHSAIRCADEGLLALDFFTKNRLEFFFPSPDLRSSLLSIGLESASIVISRDGNKLAKKYLREESDLSPLALGAFHLFNSNDTEKAIELLSKAEPSRHQQLYLAIAGREDEIEKTMQKPSPTPSTDTLLELDSVPKCSVILPWFLTVQGEVYLNKGDTTAAQNVLLKSAKLDKEIPETFYQLSRFYLKVKRDEPRAVRCLEQAFVLNPKLECVVKDLVMLFQKKSGVSNIYKKVIAAIDDVVHRGSDVSPLFSTVYLDSWIGLARYQLVEKKYADAELSLQRGIALDDKHPAAWQHLGDAYLRMGRFTAAARAFQSSILYLEDNDSLAYSLLQLGKILVTVHENEDAVRFLERSSDLKPESTATAAALANAYLHLANDLIQSGRYGLASDRIHSALQKLDTVDGLHQLRGDLYSFLSTKIPSDGNDTDNQNALRCFYKRIHQCPWESQPWQILAIHTIQHCQRGSSSCITGFRRAAECAVVLDPLDSCSWNALGVVCYLVSKKSEDDDRRLRALSLHCFVRAVQLDDDFSDAWCNLSLLLEEQGQFDLALETLTLASGSGDETLVWTSRGRIDAKLNNNKVMDNLSCSLDASGAAITTTYDSRAYLLYVVEKLKHKEQLTSLDWIELESLMHQYLLRNTSCKVGNYLYGLCLKARGKVELAKQAFLKTTPSLGEAELVELGDDGNGSVSKQIVRALVASNRKDTAVDMLKQLTTVNDDDDDDEMEVLRYVASPSQQNCTIRCVPAALKMGRVADVVPLENELTDARSRAVVEQFKGKDLTGIHMAPWESDLWLAAAKCKYSELDRLFPKDKSHSVVIGCCLAAKKLAIAKLDLPEYIRASMLEGSVLFLQNRTHELKSLSCRLFHAFPTNKVILRLVAGAGLICGNFRFARDRFGMLLGGKGDDEEEQTLLDIVGFCEAMLGLSELKIDDEYLSVLLSSKDKKFVALGLSFQGRVALQDGDHGKFEQYFLSAVKLLPSEPLLWVEFGSYLNKPEAALYCFETAAMHMEGSSRATKLRYATMVCETVAINKCFGLLNRVAKLYPKDVNVTLVRGWINLIQGDTKNRKNALSLLKSVLQVEPKHVKARTLLYEMTREEMYK